MKPCHFLFLMLLSLAGPAQKKMFSVPDYDAVADEKPLIPLLFKNQLMPATRAGAGTAYVPAGTFVTGPLSSENRLNLHCETRIMAKGKNFQHLDVADFKGSGSPVNKTVSRIFIEKGTGFSTDNAKGVINRNLDKTKAIVK